MPIVKVIRFILYPVAGPLGKILDFSLGRELATTYSNAEMMKLLQIHVQENVIDQETAGAMQGALTYKVRLDSCGRKESSWSAFVFCWLLGISRTSFLESTEHYSEGGHDTD